MVRWTHTPVSDDLIAAIDDVKDRALVVEADSRRPRCIIEQAVPATASLASDLEAVNKLFGGGEPRLIMLRLLDEANTLAGVSEKSWLLLCFMPEEAASAKKVKVEGLHESLKEHFEAVQDPLRLKSLQFAAKYDDLCKAVQEKLAEDGNAERKGAAALDTLAAQQAEKKAKEVSQQGEAEAQRLKEEAEAAEKRGAHATALQAERDAKTAALGGVEEHLDEREQEAIDRMKTQAAEIAKENTTFTSVGSAKKDSPAQQKAREKAKERAAARKKAGEGD